MNKEKPIKETFWYRPVKIQAWAFLFFLVMSFVGGVALKIKNAEFKQQAIEKPVNQDGIQEQMLQSSRCAYHSPNIDISMDCATFIEMLGGPEQVRVALSADLLLHNAEKTAILADSFDKVFNNWMDQKIRIGATKEELRRAMP